MTLKEAIKKAVDEDNATLAGRCADTMRFGFGLDYNESFAMVEKITGTDVATWDSLLYRADYEEQS